MSLGGGAYAPLDQAVAAASAAGVTVVVAAGNDDYDACYSSPARASSAITVGATNARDSRAEFSNWGRCVDVFAPGVAVQSSWSSSDTATHTISGTSMATPHVSGIASRYLQRHPTATPSQVAAAIRAAATRGAVGDPQGAPNLLAYVAPSLELPGKTVIKKATSGSTSGTLISLTARWAKPTTGGAVAKYYVTAIPKSGGAQKTVDGFLIHAEQEDHRAEKEFQLRHSGVRPECHRQRRELERLQHRQGPLIAVEPC